MRTVECVQMLSTLGRVCVRVCVISFRPHAHVLEAGHRISFFNPPHLFLLPLFCVTSLSNTSLGALSHVGVISRGGDFFPMVLFLLRLPSDEKNVVVRTDDYS